ncbi:LPO_1073/Vpar_1526 family protein [Citrobacter freundii]
MSFIDSKSGQHVGDGSTALQISGNVTIGSTVTEVLNICELVIKANMASLREDAYRVVDERTKEFANQISSKLSKDLDDQLREKLADPDVQYSINQAVIQVARKGFSEKSELLKELLVSKIKADEEEDNLLLDYALEVTQKLTTNEIKFLALIHYFRGVHKFRNDISLTELAEKNITHPAVPGLSVEQNHLQHKREYATYDLDYIRFLGDINSIKKTNKGILSIKGVIFSDSFYTTNYQSLLGNRVGIASFESDDDFFKHFPALENILNSFGINTLEDFNQIVTNDIGKIIAVNYLIAKGFLK